jgi:xanthine dehydrogenase accessory factor
VKEALRALGDGQPRLLRISKEAPSDSIRADGVVDYVMTCHSGGTLEIYVEPHHPAPCLWVVGTTPIAGALVELGAGLGFDVTLVDPVADTDAFPAAGRVVASDDLTTLDQTVSPFVVVASQGQWDEDALAQALQRDVAYVGLVASPTRASVVRDALRAGGIPEERLAALRAPAGLDLGAESAAEVALSILAELVQVRRGRAGFVAAPGPAAMRNEPQAVGGGPAASGAASIVLVDPVCGMTVEREGARHLAEHDGVVYAFCCVGCRTRFIKEPATYITAGV